MLEKIMANDIRTEDDDGKKRTSIRNIINSKYIIKKEKNDPNINEMQMF